MSMGYMFWPDILKYEKALRRAKREDFETVFAECMGGP